MSKNALTIAQVTDMHIGPSDVSYRGINPRQQFLNVLQALEPKNLDVLVLSGDLAANEGEPEAYVWIKQTLATFHCPYIVMAGNHDHAIRMKRTFELSDNDIANNMLYFSRSIKGRRLLFLDSSPYRVSKHQLEWLETQLIESNEPALLFIHHPPLKCECPFMDEHHPLQNSGEVWKVLERFSHISNIFCGHYHTEKTVIKDGKLIYLTPSTIFQIDAEKPEFAIAHTKPGWRIIKWKGTKVSTQVEYL